MIENATVKNGEVFVLEEYEDTDICSTCALWESCKVLDVTTAWCYDLFNGRFVDHFVKKDIKLKEV